MARHVGSCYSVDEPVRFGELCTDRTRVAIQRWYVSGNSAYTNRAGPRSVGPR